MYLNAAPRHLHKKMGRLRVPLERGRFQLPINIKYQIFQYFYFSGNYPKHSQTPTLNPHIGKRGRPGDTSKWGDLVAVTFKCSFPNPDNFTANVTMDVEFYSTKPNGDRLKLYPPEGQRYSVQITGQAVLYQNDFYTLYDASQSKSSPIGTNVSAHT